jgi:hypothetical protein
MFVARITMTTVMFLASHCGFELALSRLLFIVSQHKPSYPGMDTEQRARDPSSRPHIGSLSISYLFPSIKDQIVNMIALAAVLNIFRTRKTCTAFPQAKPKIRATRIRTPVSKGLSPLAFPVARRALIPAISLPRLSATLSYTVKTPGLQQCARRE